MKLTLVADSHLDHKVDPQVIEWALQALEHSDSAGDHAFVQTVAYPEYLPPTACDLIGPATGQEPVPEERVEYRVRGSRKWASRVSKFIMVSYVRTITVVSGPHEGTNGVVYTIYGGPAAPREPGDPTLGSMEEIKQIREFWALHALHVDQ